MKELPERFVAACEIGEAGALCTECWMPCDLLVPLNDVVLWRCKRSTHAPKVWDERHTTDEPGVYHAGPVDECPAPKCKEAA